MDKGTDRLCQLVKGGGRFALGDVKPHLFKVLAHCLEHKGMRIGLLEELDALIGEEPINTGEATEVAIHFCPRGNLAYAQPRVKRVALTGCYYRDIKLRGIVTRGGEINEAPDMSRAAAKSVAL